MRQVSLIWVSAWTGVRSASAFVDESAAARAGGELTPDTGMNEISGKISLEVSGGMPGGERPLFFINNAMDAVPWLNWDEGDDGIWRSGRGASLIVQSPRALWEVSLDESGPAGGGSVPTFLDGPGTRPAKADDYLEDPDGSGLTAGQLRDQLWQQQWELNLVVAGGASFQSGDADIQNPTQAQLQRGIQVNKMRLERILTAHYGAPTYYV